MRLIKISIIAVLICVLVDANSVFAQYRQQGGGRVLDNNLQVGAGRYNSRVPSNYSRHRGGFFSVRNSKGLSAFRGRLPSIDTQLRIRSVNPRTSLFRQQSVGLNDVIRGRGIYDPQNYVYQSQLRTSVNLRDVGIASYRRKTVLPGRTTAAQIGRDKTAAQLYRQATRGYQPLIVPDFDLSANAFGAESRRLAELKEKYAYNVEIQKVLNRRGDQLFGLLRSEDRAKLAKEISELKKNELFGGKEQGLSDDLVDNMVDLKTGKPVKTKTPKAGDLIRDPETGLLRRLRPGEKAPSEKKRNVELRIPKAKKDVFLDLLKKLRDKKKAEEEGKEFKLKKEKDQDEEEAAKSRNVDLDKKDKALVIRNLAGIGDDQFNKYLKQARSFMKNRRYYSASRRYRLASMLRRQNPLPHVGAILSSFGAGEWQTAANELELAIKLFPPLIEVKLSLSQLMNEEDVEKRLAALDSWIGKVKVKPSVLMLACYLNRSSGNFANSKKYAKMILENEDATEVQKSVANYVLYKKLPAKKNASKSPAKPTE